MQATAATRTRAGNAAPPGDRRRFDIQGLRALAVALVVLYHFWPARLPGGFIGVDVFFVISGFLITGHLVRQVEETGRVSLSRFWARRIRRLLPAAFVVLLACALLAWFVMPDSQLRNNIAGIASSALYVQNWFLAATSVDYLAAENAPSLTQHFWSLSAEEQFYLVWPVLVLLAVSVTTRSRRFDARRSIFVALTVVGIASLAWSIYETHRNPGSAYFVTTTRAWEFAAGGLVSFLPAVLGREKTRAAITWLGVALICGCALAFNSDTPFPGYVALLPVVATSLVLAFGQTSPRWSFAQLSRYRPIQTIGDTSYAIYMWHWPLLLAAPFVLGVELDTWAKFAIIATSILLAWLTKLSVEDPMRFGVRWMLTRRGAYSFAAAGMAVLVTMVGATAFVQNRADAARNQAIAAAAECAGAAALDPENLCTDPFEVTDNVDPAFASGDAFYSAAAALGSGECRSPDGLALARCEFGDLDSPSVTVALIGSSYGEELVEPLSLMARQGGWRLVPQVRASCSGFMTSAEADAWIADGYDKIDDVRNCVLWGQAVIDEFVQRDDIDIVLIAALSDHPAAESLAQIARLTASGKDVLFVQNPPRYPGPGTVPECVEKSREHVDPCSWVVEGVVGQPAALEAAYGVPVIPVWPAHCTPDERCHAVVGGLIVYFDHVHYSLSFSRTMVPYLTETLAPIIEKATNR